jgi:serine kinase of HPr protein (carbohydrate metabolism regulator)
MLSSETIHATSLAIGDSAILIVGPSGSGKSDLALRLIDRGAKLVSDDYTIVSRKGLTATARAPETIKDKLEVRGIGIVAVSSKQGVQIIGIFDLTEQMNRMPDLEAKRNIAGVSLPILGIRPFEASAPLKVELAVKQWASI